MKKPKLVRCENCEKLKKEKRQILQALDAQNRDMRKLRDELDAMREEVKRLRKFVLQNGGRNGADFVSIREDNFPIRERVKRDSQCEGYTLAKKSVDLLISDKFNYHYSSRVFKGVFDYTAALLRQCLKTTHFNRLIHKISQKPSFFNHHVYLRKTQVDIELFHILGSGNGVYRFNQNAAQ